MKKRFLLTLLAIALVLSVAGVTALAAYTGIKTPQIMYADGSFASQTVTTSGNGTSLPNGGFTSAQTVTAVGPTSITISGVESGSTIYYKLSSASSYSNTGSLTASSISEGVYTLTGLTQGATYNIAIKWGRHTDSSSNNYIFAQSDAITVTTKSMTANGAWPAPTGISAVDGKLTGLDSSKTYEYVQLSAPDFGIDPDSYATYNDSTLTGGLWAVRVAAGDDGVQYSYTASEAVTVYVAGANVGTLAGEAVPKASVTNDYVDGKWTFLSTAGGLGLGFSANYGFQHHVTYASQDKYLDGTYSYQLTNDEIIAVSDLFSFSMSRYNNMASHIKNTGGAAAESSKVVGAVIFHVYGGTADTYKVPFTWSTAIGYTDKFDIDLASVAGTNPTGYVYRIDIDVIDADASENANLIRSAETELYQHNGAGDYYSYQMWKFGAFTSDGRIKLTARIPEEAPTLAAEGTATDGVFKIIGLDKTKSYAISSDKITYTDVAAGSDSVEVTGAGTYYVYTKAGATTYASKVVSIKIDGAMPAIPEGTLTYDEDMGTITGLDNLPSGYNALTYEWCRVSLDGNLAWDQTASNTDVAVSVGCGYYAFRYAARGNFVAGASTYIFVYEGGSNKGSVSSAVDPDKTNNFVPGYWTISGIAPNYWKAYNEGANKRLAAIYNPDLDTVLDLAWQYQLADDEIFPLNELSSLKFSIGFANGNPFNSTYSGYVRVYVADGDEPYFDVPFNAANNTTLTLDIASLWADEVAADPNFEPAGYVIALEFRYYSESTLSGVTVEKPAQNYPVMSLSGQDVALMRASSFVNLKQSVDTTSIKAIAAVGTYGGEIIGLNAEALYQVAEYDETAGELTTEWTDVPAGSTVVNLPAGTYAVRAHFTADNPNFVSSDYVIVTIAEAVEGDTRDSVKVSKIILPEDVVFAEADYVFDIEDSRWINRLALSNIVVESPASTIVFEADDYRFIVSAADIDLSLDTAHYFDMKVTFDGESAYDRMYSKMAAIADEKELIKGLHFESSTAYFFEKATFEVNLGEKYDGYEVELRSYNERVNRLRNEETVTVEDGWASFSTFGGDYLILSPAFAEEAE